MTGSHTPHLRHSVLVVDDDPVVRKLLGHILSHEGFEVWMATDAGQAFAILAERLPCLLLSDVMLPDVDGFEICSRLKHDPRTAHIPVTLITASAGPAHVHQVLAAGAVDYIKKPFDRDEILMRVRIQIRLHESMRDHQRLERQLTVISSAAKDAIIIMDGEGRVSHWNKAAESIFGYSPTEILGHDLHSLLAPAAFGGEYEKAAPRFRATGAGSIVGQTVELVAIRKSGEEFPIELSLASAVVDDAWCAVGIARDISERKRAEIALQRKEEEYRTLYDASRDALMTLAPPAWRFASCNSATVELFRAKSAAEILAIGPPDLSPEFQPDGRPSADRAKEMIEQAVRDGFASFLWTHRRLDGEEFPADVLLTRTERAGELLLQATVRDNTEKREIEAQLGHARKLEAVGQLAAGIAHEINTPAQYIGDNIHFLRETFADYRRMIDQYRGAVEALSAAGEHEALVHAIRRAEDDLDIADLDANVSGAFESCTEGISRVSTIVKAMKEFAHPDQRDKCPADLNQALANTLTIASNELRYLADVETDFGSLLPVLCHIGDLNQVFLNLIVNSAHAIGDVVGQSGARGRIRIRTSQEGDSVRIDISDTGGGIPDSIRHRVFEPFFTTKEVGKGTGQGLAIARSIVVTKHHGSMDFVSEVGEGTTFTIRLPIDGEAAEGAALAA
jgi:two-component system, NtrC family, sensor kinase